MKKFYVLIIVLVLASCEQRTNSSYNPVYDTTPASFGAGAKTLSDDTSTFFSSGEINVLNDTTPTYSKFKSVKMGAQYNSTSGGTAFRFFAPNASKVSLCIYNKADRNYQNPDGILPMHSSSSGVWYVGTKSAQPLTSWYRYKVEDSTGAGMVNYQGARLTGTETVIQDPYARANVQCDGHSIIIDPSRTSLSDPTPWVPATFATPNTEDLIIYEVHIGDFTKRATGSSIPTVSAFQTADQAKYKGLKQAIPYFKDLGINCLELMPVAEFTTDSLSNPHGYSWGYMPVLFFAPEAGYSSDITTGSGYYELRDLINECHKQGIAVILDVVLTHTSNVYNVLYWSDPKDRYYFHLDGTAWANLGTGNWIADGERQDTGWNPASDPNRPFAKKLVLDSLRYWVEEFHVDGFRFDLLVGTAKTTLQRDRTELAGLNSKIFLTAENWLGSTRHNWLVGQGFSQWNDYFRESGKNRFLAMQDNTTTRDRLRASIYFSLGIDDGIGFVRANNPIDTTNYLESHDEQTVASATAGSWAKSAIGATLLLTSLGLPMVYEGEEFARALTKAQQQAQDENTQAIDWSLATSRASFYKYFRYLVRLRRDNPAFRLASNPTGGYRTDLAPIGNNLAVGYVFNESGTYGPNTFVVLLNMNSTDVDFTLPTGTWKAQCAVLGNGDPYNNTDLVFLGDGVTLPVGNDFDTWGTSSTTWLLNGYSAVVLKK